MPKLLLVYICIFSLGLVDLSNPGVVIAQGLPETFNSTQTSGGSSDLDLTISPPITYLSIRPGESKSIPLTIKNNGDRDLGVKLQLAEFSSDGQTGHPILNLTSQFAYLKPRNPAWQWGQTVVLKQDQTAQIWLDLAVPAQAPIGESHLTILARGSQLALGSTNTSSVAGIVGSNLVVAIANEATDLSQVELDRWQVPRYIDSLRGLDMTGLVKNTGRQAGPILGKASLISPTGQTLKVWLFYPDMVLPDSTREVRVIDITTDPTADPNTWFSQPNLQPTNHLQYQPSWLLGNYSLKLELYEHDYTTQPRWQRIMPISALPFGLLALGLGLPLCYCLVSWLRTINWQKFKSS